MWKIDSVLNAEDDVGLILILNTIELMKKSPLSKSSFEIKEYGENL